MPPPITNITCLLTFPLHPGVLFQSSLKCCPQAIGILLLQRSLGSLLTLCIEFTSTRYNQPEHWNILLENWLQSELVLTVFWYGFYYYWNTKLQDAKCRNRSTSYECHPCKTFLLSLNLISQLQMSLFSKKACSGYGHSHGSMDLGEKSFPWLLRAAHVTKPTAQEGHEPFGCLS